MTLFSVFYASLQQDAKLFLFFPILCAIFRAIFIRTYCPYPSLKGKGAVVFHCFRYGFWWGMDFNAYVFLIPLVLVSLPGAFFPAYAAMGDTLRLIGGMLYALVLYLAFAGKMIFYFHFHDIYNQILKLGANAEKHNLADIFFHQNHGALILLGIIPYEIFCWAAIRGLLSLPSLPYPEISSTVLRYAFNTVIFLGCIAAFYWFRYGGTFMHDDKPEWDTIPSLVKKDVFFAKATVDDLVALEQVMKHDLNEAYQHTDEEDLKAIAPLTTVKTPLAELPNPAFAFLRTASGPRITKPKHIFLFVGETYLQQFFDPEFACLNLVSGGRWLKEDAHTAAVTSALSAGIISRPSIVSLMSGIFDAGLELNEKESFWKNKLPTALPRQLAKLGYHSTYWYGGNVTYGNFNQFAPSCGFDEVETATDFCGPDAPKTWVGVYDNVFLEKAAEMILKGDKERGPYQFHFLYTTSYHGPFKIPLAHYGYDTEKVMPDAPEDIKRNKATQKNLGTFWFSDQAVGKFLKTMKEAFPDSLFIVTGDHSYDMSAILSHTSLMQRECNLRERHSPVLFMNHPEIDQSIFAGNTIGGHMNIAPTIFELIAPKGFQYYAINGSLLEPIDHVVSPYHWLTRDAYGTYENDFYQPLGPAFGPDALKEGEPPFQKERNGYMDLTGYLVRHPELLGKEA
jgi:lipoteichoic acid synthase